MDRLGLMLAGRLLPTIFRVAYTGLRYEVEGAENQSRWEGGQPVVFVTWHGRLLPLLHLYRGRGLVMLVSRHRDGEYLTRLGQALGYRAVRGSSTHGGYPALRQLVRELKQGHSLAVTPDGPQGPREQLKPGALQAARIAGVPVIPVMAGTGRAWWIEGWDRFLVPKPFARVRVAVGKPWEIPRDGTELEVLAVKLEAYMRQLKERVDGAAFSRPAR